MINWLSKNILNFWFSIIKLKMDEIKSGSIVVVKLHKIRSKVTLCLSPSITNINNISYSDAEPNKSVDENKRYHDSIPEFLGTKVITVFEVIASYQSFFQMHEDYETQTFFEKLRWGFTLYPSCKRYILLTDMGKCVVFNRHVIDVISQ